MITPRFRYNAGLGVMINIGDGTLVDVPADQAAAYWATGAAPPGVTLTPVTPYGQAPIAPLPVGGAAPGGSAPDYSPFSPAPWPPQDTNQIAALGIPCLPPDWPGAGSGYYNSGSSPVPAACTSLSADQLTRTTGEPLSAYGVAPCSPGSQQLCSSGQANGMPLPSVIYGGPGGGIAFQPGGAIISGGGGGGSGPSGIQTPADISTSRPSNVLTPPTQARTVTPQSMTNGGTGTPNQGSGLTQQQQVDPFAGFTLPQWLKDDWIYIAGAVLGVMLLPSIMSSFKK